MSEETDPFDRDDTVLVLRPLKSDVRASIRMRALLKILKRSYRFECVRLSSAPRADAKAAATVTA